MSELPNCPRCNSEYTYQDGELFVCPECAHEWTKEMQENTTNDEVIRDSNGNILNDGDSVIVIKNLTVKAVHHPLRKAQR